MNAEDLREQVAKLHARAVAAEDIVTGVEQALIREPADGQYDAVMLPARVEALIVDRDRYRNFADRTHRPIGCTCGRHFLVNEIQTGPLPDGVTLVPGGPLDVMSAAIADLVMPMRPFGDTADVSMSSYIACEKVLYPDVADTEDPDGPPTPAP